MGNEVGNTSCYQVKFYSNCSSAKEGSVKERLFQTNDESSVLFSSNGLISERRPEQTRFIIGKEALEVMPKPTAAWVMNTIWRKLAFIIP